MVVKTINLDSVFAALWMRPTTNFFGQKIQKLHRKLYKCFLKVKGFPEKL